MDRHCCVCNDLIDDEDMVEVLYLSIPAERTSYLFCPRCAGNMLSFYFAGHVSEFKMDMIELQNQEETYVNEEKEGMI
jgi:hypothetical protein